MAPKVSVDLSNVPSFEPLPAGKYECIIEEVKYGLSKASSQPKLSWVFAVAEGEFEGRKIFHTTSLQPKALFSLQKLLSGLGLPSDAALEIEYDEETEEVTEPNVIGVAVLATVTKGMYDGRANNSIESVVASSVLTGAGGKKATAGKPKFQ